MQTGNDEYTESICRPRYHTYKRSNRNTLRGHFSISNHIKNLIEPLDRENSAHHFDIYFVFVALKAKAVKIFKEKLITTVTSSGHYVIHLTANFQYSS